MNTFSRPALFFDRDGTIIPDLNYASDHERVELLPGVIAGFHALRQHRFALIMISNQSGVGRGLLSLGQFHAVHQKLLSMLQRGGIALDGSYYCLHSPASHCTCRKPFPELVLRAARAHNIDMKRSVFVGDKQIDLQTGRNAGLRSILFGQATLPNGTHGHTAAQDWHCAVQRILAVYAEEPVA